MDANNAYGRDDRNRRNDEQGTNEKITRADRLKKLQDELNTLESGTESQKNRIIRKDLDQDDRPMRSRGGDGDRRPWTPREGGDRDRPRFGGDRNDRPRYNNDRDSGERRPWTPREGQDNDRPRFGGDRNDRPRFNNDREGGERRPWTPREGGNREGGERRPWTPREGGDRNDRPRFGGDRNDRPRYNNDREGGERRPWTPREGGDRNDRPRFGGDRNDRPRYNNDREGGERRPWTPREGGERKPWTPREGGDRNDRPRYNNDREGGERRSWTPREGGERRPWTPREGGDRNDRPRYNNDREGGERRQWTPREGNDRPRYNDRDGGERRPWTPREGGGDRERSSYGDRPRFGDRDQRGGYDRNDGPRERRFPKDRDRKVDTRRKNRGDEPMKPVTINFDEPIRLNRFIANAGVCSRRKADELIAEGKILVNGTAITELGSRVNPGDVVEFNGKQLKLETLVYILLNKPKDYITTLDDPEDRKTVMTLVEGATDERIFPVGRLDRNTTGLLLLTNDGEVAQKLTHPSNEIGKIYDVVLDKPLSKADFERISAGVELEDGMAYVDAVAFPNPEDKTSVGLEIHSGRNRIVRRIFESLGYDVVKLDRVLYAGLTKKDLPRGSWRYLSEKEIRKLKTT